MTRFQLQNITLFAKGYQNLDNDIKRYQADCCTKNTNQYINNILSTGSHNESTMRIRGSPRWFILNKSFIPYWNNNCFSQRQNAIASFSSCWFSAIFSFKFLILVSFLTSKLINRIKRRNKSLERAKWKNFQYSNNFLPGTTFD